MKIVVTYFEPFGGRTVNASKATAMGLKAVETYGLPVSWNDISERLDEVLSLNPDFLFLIGEAGKIDKPRLELEAHNLSKGKDNYGVEKSDEPIIKDGPSTLYTSLVTDDGFVLSTDAGTYLCNCSYYLALTKSQNTKVIFIHVPAFNEEDMDKKAESIKIVSSMINHLVELN